jgi:tetratricopeptide (TPR) repeat protein
VTAELQVAAQKRRRRMQAAFAAVVLLLVTVIGVGLWRYDRQMRGNEFERQQLAQQSRFEKIQIVTDAVARLEQLRDQCREGGEYAQTEKQALEIGARWDAAADALERSSTLFEMPECGDPSIALRVDRLRAEIATGIAKAKPLLKRTEQRQALLGIARYRASRGETSEAISFANLAIEKDPSSPTARVMRGDFECRLGQFETALLSYTSARPLVVAHLPTQTADIDARIARATYLAGPGRQLAERWNGTMPESPASACDLAEYFLLTGHHDRAASLYTHAFASDPKSYPAHRLTAALTATLGGSGLGATPPDAKWRGKLRELAEAWLPEFTPPDAATSSGQVVYEPLKSLVGFDSARYRFIRAVLPVSSRPGDWNDYTFVTATHQKEAIARITVFADSLVGSPYPGKSMLAELPLPAGESRDVSAFLDRVMPRHVRYDQACIGWEWTSVTSGRFTPINLEVAPTSTPRLPDVVTPSG